MVFQEPSQTMLPVFLQCWDYITEQQHCENRNLCFAFQTHCLEGDSKCKRWPFIYTLSRLDDLQLPLRKVNAIVATIVTHLIK